MGKWIGQHIFDLIAQFKSDVFFKSVENADSDLDKFLVLGSSGKLKYRTGAEVASDIGATGDITAVKFTTDSGGGSPASFTEGAANFSLLGSSGVGVTNSDTTITVTSVPGEIDHDSLLNFVANEHLRWDTDVSGTATIHASNIPTLNQDTTGTADIATSATIVAANSTAGTHYITFVDGATGTQGLETDTNLSYVPQTNLLTAGGFIGAGGGLTGLDSSNITASTSNALGIGSIELGHADDTTIARSAAGIITVEGKQVITADKTRVIVNSNFKDDLGTSEHFIPMHSVAENTSNTSENTAIIAPYAGKLLELHYRTNFNASGATATWKLVRILKSAVVNSANNDILDTQTTTGPTNTLSGAGNLVKVTFDSDASFAAGDMLAVSVTHDTDVTNSNSRLYITCIFEYDLSSL